MKKLNEGKALNLVLLGAVILSACSSTAIESQAIREAMTEPVAALVVIAETATAQPTEEPIATPSPTATRASPTLPVVKPSSTVGPTNTSTATPTPTPTATPINTPVPTATATSDPWNNPSAHDPHFNGRYYVGTGQGQIVRGAWAATSGSPHNCYMIQYTSMGGYVTDPPRVYSTVAIAANTALVDISGGCWWSYLGS